MRVGEKGYGYNPYKVLGVADDADLKVVKAAYRKLVKLYHPDLGGDTQKFLVIQEAFEDIETGAFKKRQQQGLARKTGTTKACSFSTLFDFNIITC